MDTPNQTNADLERFTDSLWQLFVADIVGKLDKEVPGTAEILRKGFASGAIAFKISTFVHVSGIQITAHLVKDGEEVFVYSGDLPHLG